MNLIDNDMRELHQIRTGLQFLEEDPGRDEEQLRPFRRGSFQSHLIANGLTDLFAPFGCHAFGNGYGRDATGLGDDDVARGTGVKEELGYLGGFSASGVPGEDGDAMRLRLDGGEDGRAVGVGGELGSVRLHGGIVRVCEFGGLGLMVHLDAAGEVDRECCAVVPSDWLARGGLGLGLGFGVGVVGGCDLEGFQCLQYLFVIGSIIVIILRMHLFVIVVFIVISIAIVIFTWITPVGMLWSTIDKRRSGPCGLFPLHVRRWKGPYVILQRLSTHTAHSQHWQPFILFTTTNTTITITTVTLSCNLFPPGQFGNDNPPLIALARASTLEPDRETEGVEEFPFGVGEVGGHFEAVECGVLAHVEKHFREFDPSGFWYGVHFGTLLSISFECCRC